MITVCKNTRSINNNADSATTVSEPYRDPTSETCDGQTEPDLLYYDADWTRGKECKKKAIQQRRQEPQRFHMVIAKDAACAFADETSTQSGTHMWRMYAPVDTMEPLHRAARYGIDRHFRSVVDASGTCLPFAYVNALIHSNAPLTHDQLARVIEKLRIESTQALSDAINQKFSALLEQTNDFGDSEEESYNHDELSALEAMFPCCNVRMYTNHIRGPDGSPMTDDVILRRIQAEWSEVSWLRFTQCPIEPEQFASSSQWRLSPAVTAFSAIHGGKCITEVKMRHVLVHSAFDTTTENMRLFATDARLSQPRTFPLVDPTSITGKIYNIANTDGMLDVSTEADPYGSVTWAFDDACYDPAVDHLCLAQTPGHNAKLGALHMWTPMTAISFIQHPGAHDFADQLSSVRSVILEIKDHPTKALRNIPEANIAKRSSGLKQMREKPYHGPEPLVLFDKGVEGVLLSLPARPDYPLSVVMALLTCARNHEVSDEVIIQLHNAVAQSLPDGPLRESPDELLRVYRGIRRLDDNCCYSIEDSFIEKTFLACFPGTQGYTQSPAYKALFNKYLEQLILQTTTVTMSPDYMKENLNVQISEQVHVRYLEPFAHRMINEGIRVLYMQSPLGSGKSTAEEAALPILAAHADRMIKDDVMAAREADLAQRSYASEHERAEVRKEVMDAPVPSSLVVAICNRRSNCPPTFKIIENAFGKGTVEMYDKRMNAAAFKALNDQKLNTYQKVLNGTCNSSKSRKMAQSVTNPKKLSAKGSLKAESDQDENARKTKPIYQVTVDKHKVYQFESLHKLLDFVMAHPGRISIVILDESESILYQTKSPTNGDNLEANLYTMRKMLQGAQYILCLDGLMTDRSIRCIQGLCGHKPAMYIKNTHKGNNEPVIDQANGRVIRGPQKVIELLGSTGQRGKHSLAEMAERFGISLTSKMAAAGQKLFFGSGFQSVIQGIDERLSQGNMLPESKKIIRIDSTQQHSMDLMGNMTEWFADPDIAAVMASPTLTVGNNADLEFERRVILASAKSADPFAMVQMSGRVRHFRNRTMYLILDDHFERDSLRSGDVFRVFDRSKLDHLARRAGIHDQDFINVWVHNTQISNVSRYYYRAVMLSLLQQLGYEVHLAKDPYEASQEPDANAHDVKESNRCSTEVPAEAPTKKPKKAPKVPKTSTLGPEPTDAAWNATEAEIKDIVRAVIAELDMEAEERKRKRQEAIENDEVHEKDDARRKKAPEWSTVAVIKSEDEIDGWVEKMYEGDPMARAVINKRRYIRMFTGRDMGEPHPQHEKDLYQDLVNHWDAMFPNIERMWTQVFYRNMRMTCGDKAEKAAFFKCRDCSFNFMDRLKPKYQVISMITEGLLDETPKADDGTEVETEETRRDAQDVGDADAGEEEEGPTNDAGLFVLGKVIKHDNVKKVGGSLLCNMRSNMSLFELKPRKWNKHYSDSQQTIDPVQETQEEKEAELNPMHMQHSCAIISDILKSWTGGLFQLSKGPQKQARITDSKLGKKTRIDISDYVIECNNENASPRMIQCFLNTLIQ